MICILWTKSNALIKIKSCRCSFPLVNSQSLDMEKKKSIPFVIFALTFSPNPINSRNPDPGPHSRLFSPLPATVRALHFYREKISALSSLVDSRRIVPTHAINRLSQQLILFFMYWYFVFLLINSKFHHDGIRTPGPTLVAIEGTSI